MKQWVKYGAQTLLIVWTGAVAAADYDVEILVYAHLRHGGGEHWPLPQQWPAVEHALSLGEAGTQRVDGRVLQAIADNLRASRQYRPLLHWRWRQPGWSPANVKAVHVQIPAGSAVPLTQPPALLDKHQLARLRTLLGQPQPMPADQPLLDGTVALAIEQFPVLSVNLIYLDRDAHRPVQLRETRRLREGELNYLDNPRFSVLTQVGIVR